MTSKSSPKFTTMTKIPFKTIDWSKVPKSEHPGESGTATWQIVNFPGIRLRLVEYSPGYMADHWCHKGHIVHCLEGSFVTQLESGEQTKLTKGMSYVVSDNMSSHRSVSADGVKLLIVDGDFLRSAL